MFKKINLGVVVSVFCLFSLASAKTTLSQNFSFYGVEGLVTETVVNKISNLRIDLDGQGFSREHLSSAVMETLVKVFQQRKVQYQKITIAEKGQPDLILDGDPNPWLRLWKGISERFFERYHRHLPATMLNNLIAFATGGTLTALAAGPFSLVIGVGFVFYLGKNAADIGVDIYWGRYEQAGAKIFDLVNDLLFAAAGGAWAQKLIAKSSTKFFGLLFRSMRDFAKGPPIEGAPPAKGALIEWDPEGHYAKVKETPKVGPAVPSKPSVRTLPAVNTAPLISNSGLLTLEAIAPNVAAHTKGALDSKAHFVPLPIPDEDERELVYISPAFKAFKLWRKNFVSVSPELGAHLDVFESLLKKDPYGKSLKKISSLEVKSLDALMWMLNHGQLAPFPDETALSLRTLQSVAHRIANENEEESAPKSRETASKDYATLVQEAFNGALLTYHHIQALRMAEEWCRTSEAAQAKSYCATVRRLLATAGDNFSRFVVPHEAAIAEDTPQKIENAFQNYLEVNGITIEQSAMASHVLDPTLADRVRELFVEFVNSGQSTKDHPYKLRFNSDFAHKIQAEKLPDLETVRIFPKGGRNFEKADAKLVCFHGMGGWGSSNVAWYNAYMVLGSHENGTGVSKSDTRKRLIQEYGENFPIMSMEGVDMMGHGNGPSILKYPTVDSVVAWMKAYIDSIRAEYTGPIVVVTKSASPMFVMELDHRYPGLIDGIFMISPMYPGFPDELHRKISDEAYRVMDIRGPAVVNKTSYDWIDILAQESFWTHQVLETKTPIMITTGDDSTVVDVERSIYRSMDYKYPHIEYEDIPGVGHDIFRATKNNDKYASDKSYSLFVKFVNRVRETKAARDYKAKTRKKR